MTCRVKVVQLNEIYMCTEFHMNTCKYVWAIHQVFRLCSRGRRRAPVPRPGPSLCGVLMAAVSNVCANFQEFSCMLRAPKPPKTLKKKKKKIIIILRKTRGPCALLAWALIICKWGKQNNLISNRKHDYFDLTFFFWKKKRFDLRIRYLDWKQDKKCKKSIFCSV